MSAAASPAPILEALQAQLSKLSDLRSALLLTPEENSILVNQADEDAETLLEAAHAAQELLEATRNFRLDTHWLRLSGTEGMVYAVAEPDTGVLVLVAGGPRLSSGQLDALQNCLKGEA